MNPTLDLLRAHRTVRRYTDEPVAEEHVRATPRGVGGVLRAERREPGLIRVGPSTLRDGKACERRP